MKIGKDLRGLIGSCAAVLTAVCLLGATPKVGRAQNPVPSSVLIFPAHIDGAANNPSAKLTQKLLTDALRKSISRLGIGAVIYDKNLPSIQRAVQESEKGIKADEAAAGPGDDMTKAKRLAEVSGAPEFIIAIVEDYKYDAKSRTATFNLSLSRSSVADGPINNVANKQSGAAPADVAPSRQEGSAIVRAVEVAADQGILQLYPDVRVPGTNVVMVKKRTSAEKYAVPGFLIGLGVLFFSTR